MAIPNTHTMLPLGRTATEQQGDWLITWEVVGWNERLQVNQWTEKRRQWKPRPSLAEAIKAIDAERQYQYTRNLHRVCSD